MRSASDDAAACIVRSPHYPQQNYQTCLRVHVHARALDSASAPALAPAPGSAASAPAPAPAAAEFAVADDDQKTSNSLAIACRRLILPDLYRHLVVTLWTA